MRLTPRRRFVIAMLVSWPLGFAYLYWLYTNGVNVVRDLRNGNLVCTGGLWVTIRNGCDPSTFSQPLAWTEIVVVSLIMIAIGFGLARWVLRPVQTMADTVAQFGPTSLGLRMRATGPKDETRKLSDAIDVMLDRVAEGYDAQARFAANASHELRTPLATQRALIEVSLSSALTPDQLELLSRQLLATNERNEALIEGLLALAETERGLMSRAPQRLDLIAASAIELYRSTATERGIEFTSELSTIAIPGELPLLERLANNLVQNAVKYNVENGWVRVTVTTAGNLTVANSGPRVAPEQVAALFEAFRRARGDRLEHGGGVGLGLTIARSVVAAHHGVIEAQANPEGGLTVEARLPTT